VEAIGVLMEEEQQVVLQLTVQLVMNKILVIVIVKVNALEQD